MKTCNNGGVMMVWRLNQFTYGGFFMILLIFKMFINIHDYANNLHIR